MAAAAVLRRWAISSSRRASGSGSWTQGGSKLSASSPYAHLRIEQPWTRGLAAGLPTSSSTSRRDDNENKEEGKEYQEESRDQRHGATAAAEAGWTLGQVATLPNGISAARLASGPLLAMLIMQGHSLTALGGVAAAGVSDWLDGYIAKNTSAGRQSSVLGSYLDPLADKVVMGCVALAMAARDLLPGALVGMIVARDAALILGGFYSRAASLSWRWRGWAEFFRLSSGGAEQMQPLMISKANTALQLALVAAVLAHDAASFPHTTAAALPALSALVAATTVMSTGAYGAEYLERTWSRPLVIDSNPDSNCNVSTSAAAGTLVSPADLLPRRRPS
eukprot:jgi/Chlat1/963/Chrsp108S01434